MDNFFITIRFNNTDKKVNKEHYVALCESLNDTMANFKVNGQNITIYGKKWCTQVTEALKLLKWGFEYVVDNENK